MTRGVCVEFVGMPGSGKSALSRAAARELAARGVVVDQTCYHLAHGRRRPLRVLAKLGHVAVELMRHPRRSLQAWSFVRSTRQPTTRSGAKLLFNLWLVRGLTRRAQRRGGIHFFDQGLLQAVLSLALEGDADRALQVLSSPVLATPLPDLFVFVEVDLALVEARIRARPERDSRVDRQLDRDPQILSRCAALLTRVVALGRDTGVPLTVVDNGAPVSLEREAARLADRVGALAPKASGTAV